jgi:hypothetical protein
MSSSVGKDFIFGFCPEGFRPQPLFDFISAPFPIGKSTAGYLHLKKIHV